MGTAALGCPAEQRSAISLYRQNLVELRSTGQPGAAVPTRSLVLGRCYVIAFAKSLRQRTQHNRSRKKRSGKEQIPFYRIAEER